MVHHVLSDTEFPASGPLKRPPDLTSGTSPPASRRRPLLSEDHSDQEFGEALEALLDRLELDLSQ